MYRPRFDDLSFSIVNTEALTYAYHDMMVNMLIALNVAYDTYFLFLLDCIIYGSSEFSWFRLCLWEAVCFLFFLFRVHILQVFGRH